MHLSKTASYSLNVLSFMAKNEGAQLSAATLHEKLGIPYPYLRQILKELTKNGLIASERGRKGGFSFSKPLNTISLADIIDATDGMASLKTCILGFNPCPLNERCNMHDLWQSTMDNIAKILNETTLADLGKKR